MFTFAKAKSRAVTREAAKKYDVTYQNRSNLFRKLLFNINFLESFVYYQTISMYLRNELYGVILTVFKKSKYLSTMDY